ncbi:flavodoxin family protein [Vibrio sp. Of7-15]|uniref:flavodoxin family protein n=1 Tax=Vibrio sp. Of7-15 TaxID=2724879 RepID=UPI001EF1D313|nr:flavodoxin family protein [Vibrio sp. Of7-15]MCG7497633.1 flavodoxin family protein [Vibrio sp. Of7-15]
MKSIAIVYFSKTGTTHALAEAIKNGAQDQETATATLYPLSGKDIIEGRYDNTQLFTELRQADAIIFGSPTYMGGPAAQFKAFADASSETWGEQLWRNKIAAGFTCGGSLNGEQEQTLLYFFTLASQHGMLWAGLDMPNGYEDKTINRLGVQFGASAATEDNGKVQTIDIKTAQYLGERIAGLLV